VSDVSPTPGPSFNWRHLVGLVMAAVIVTGGVYVVVNERAGDQVIVRVGDSELTEGELFAIIESGDPLVQDETIELVVAGDVLSNWLIVEAVVLELSDRGVEVSQDAVDQGEAAALAGDQDPSSASGALRVRSEAVVVTLRAYSELNAEFDVVAPEYLCASHVLLDTAEGALAVMARLEEGEDIGDLGAELSIDPSAVDNRGDLGCNPTARFVEPFSAGARSAGGPGVVGPVQTDFGFHVIDVRSVGPLSAETHPEMSVETIEAELELAGADGLAAARTEVFNQIVTNAQLRLVDDGYIDARYGTWDPGAGIVLPDGVVG